MPKYKFLLVDRYGNIVAERVKECISQHYADRYASYLFIKSYGNVMDVEVKEIKSKAEVKSKRRTTRTTKSKTRKK